MVSLDMIELYLTSNKNDAIIHHRQFIHGIVDDKKKYLEWLSRSGMFEVLNDTNDNTDLIKIWEDILTPYVIDTRDSSMIVPLMGNYCLTDVKYLLKLYPYVSNHEEVMDKIMVLDNEKWLNDMIYMISDIVSDIKQHKKYYLNTIGTISGNKKKYTDGTIIVIMTFIGEFIGYESIIYRLLGQLITLSEFVIDRHNIFSQFVSAIGPDTKIPNEGVTVGTLFNSYTTLKENADIYIGVLLSALTHNIEVGELFDDMIGCVLAYSSRNKVKLEMTQILYDELIYMILNKSIEVNKAYLNDVITILANRSSYDKLLSECNADDLIELAFDIILTENDTYDIMKTAPTNDTVIKLINKMLDINDNTALSLIKYINDDTHRFKNILHIMVFMCIEVFEMMKDMVLSYGADKLSQPPKNVANNRQIMSLIANLIGKVVTLLTSLSILYPAITDMLLDNSLIKLTSGMISTFMFYTHDVLHMNSWVFDELSKTARNNIISMVKLCLRLYTHEHKNRQHIVDRLRTYNIDIEVTRSRIVSMINYMSSDTSLIPILATLGDEIINDPMIIDDDVEYPEEFLDPIEYIPINDPVILPVTNTIMDRSIIESLLFTAKQHPITQAALTMNEVDEYTKSEGKSIIDDFRARYDNWKMSTS